MYVIYNYIMLSTIGEKYFYTKVHTAIKQCKFFSLSHTSGYAAVYEFFYVKSTKG